MNRREFEQLRDLPDKEIRADIEFRRVTGAGPNLIFDGVPLENSLEWDVLLNGTYKPDIPAATFNFVVRGVGPVCRLDVNGTRHGQAGRIHKHDVTDEHDPRRNLPTVVARPD
jgi:hypothetical protein